MEEPAGNQYVHGKRQHDQIDFASASHPNFGIMSDAWKSRGARVANGHNSVAPVIQKITDHWRGFRSGKAFGPLRVGTGTAKDPTCTDSCEPSDETQALNSAPAIGVPQVPVPAAGWVMVAAFGGLAALRRKRTT